jgi:hypothetical protein
MEEQQVNGFDSSVAAQDAKLVYMERVYKMTHGELFHELMRVHTESAKMIMELQSELERVAAGNQDDVNEQS